MELPRLQEHNEVGKRSSSRPAVRLLQYIFHFGYTEKCYLISSFDQCKSLPSWITSMDCVLWRNQVCIVKTLICYSMAAGGLMKSLVLQAGGDIFSRLSGALEDWISFLTLPCGFCVICGIGRQFYLLLDSCSQGRRRTLFLRGKFRYCTWKCQQVAYVSLAQASVWLEVDLPATLTTPLVSHS